MNELAEALERRWARCHSAQLGPVTTHSCHNSVLCCFQNPRWSFRQCGCLYLLLHYADVPTVPDGQHLLTNVGKEVTSKDVQKDVHHPCTEKLRTYNVIKQDCWWSQPFSPRCHSCYLKSLPEHYHRGLSMRWCRFRKADAQIIQF